MYGLKIPDLYYILCNERDLLSLYFLYSTMNNQHIEETAVW